MRTVFPSFTRQKSQQSRGITLANRVVEHRYDLNPSAERQPSKSLFLFLNSGRVRHMCLSQTAAGSSQAGTSTAGLDVQTLQSVKKVERWLQGELPFGAEGDPDPTMQAFLESEPSLPDPEEQKDPVRFSPKRICLPVLPPYELSLERILHCHLSFRRD